GMALVLKQLTNFMGRTPVFKVGSNPFPGVGERSPTLIRGGTAQEYFGAYVSLWLLASSLSFMDEANEIRDAIKGLVLKNVQGLPILEDGKYVCWPEVLDPDPNQVVAERAGTLRSFVNELQNWPPLTALGLLGTAHPLVKEYEALERGLTALADVYHTMSQAGVRWIRMEPPHSILGIAAVNAWRVMLLNPLDANPLGQPFAALQQSGLV